MTRQQDGHKERQPSPPAQTPAPRVTADYARTLLQELERLGGDPQRLWRDAGVEVPMRELLHGSAVTLPAVAFTRLYRGCMEAIERLCCAREGRRPLGKPAVNMLCYCLISCGTLREAIARAAAFNAAMEERGGVLDLQEREGIAHFTMHVPDRRRDSAALLVDLTGLYFYFQLFSWLIGYRLPLTGAGMPHHAPRGAHPFVEVLGVPLMFDQPTNSLSFPASHLDKRIVRTASELQAIIDYFPFDLSPGGDGHATLSDQLRLLLLDSLQQLGRMPELGTAAQLLHMSAATLRRRLAAEGTSFREVRANCQRDIAAHLLRHGNTPVEDIARRVGLSDDRALRRAFREWTGETPADYRKQFRLDPEP